MKKIRFKNRNGKLYYGFDGVFKSAGMKDTKVNRNIITSKFNNGLLDESLGIKTLGVAKEIPKINDLIARVLDQREKVLKQNSYITYSKI